jgi:hypothetical protein
MCPYSAFFDTTITTHHSPMVSLLGNIRCGGCRADGFNADGVLFLTSSEA